MSTNGSSKQREEWLLRRRHGITATDIAAIAGLSPWKTALDVFLDKRGLVPERPASAEMLWGLRLEPVIAEAYQEQTGKTLSEIGLSVHPQIPWIMATPDRIREDKVLVELKCARVGKHWGDVGTEEIPDIYRLQVQWQMLATGAQAVDVAVLIGGSDFRIYHIERQPHLLEVLKEMADMFWHKVQQNIPPAIDLDHPTTLRAIQALYPAERGIVVCANTEIEALATRHVALADKRDSIEKELAQTKAQLIEKLGRFEKAQLPSGGTILRKLINRKAYTCEVPATSYETIKINLSKETSEDE
jgi:putative phage-type endonuclease